MKTRLHLSYVRQLDEACAHPGTCCTWHALRLSAHLRQRQGFFKGSQQCTHTFNYHHHILLLDTNAACIPDSKILCHNSCSLLGLYTVHTRTQKQCTLTGALHLPLHPRGHTAALDMLLPCMVQSSSFLDRMPHNKHLQDLDHQAA